jgi:hypothetical protein
VGVGDLGGAGTWAPYAMLAAHNVRMITTAFLRI